MFALPVGIDHGGEGRDGHLAGHFLVVAGDLVASGVREVNLLGQNVNAYRGVMHDGEIADLALLISWIAAIDGIDRIRYTTSHPLEMSDSLIAAYAEIPQLVGHLHLPVQSGSDRILAQMKRNHTALEYRAIIRRRLVRDQHPRHAATTTASRRATR